MSTIQQKELSNDSSDKDGHVEMTNELPTEHDSVEAESIGDHDVTILRSPAKDSETNRSFSSDEETHPNSQWGSTIDGDTRSTSSNTSWGTAIYTDMRFTMVSNACFFVGACIQTYTSFADLKSAEIGALEDDDNWDDDSDDDYVNTALDKTYYALYSLGPFLYIINAFIDVRWLTEQTTSPWSLSFWCHRFYRSNNSSIKIENLEQEEQCRRIIEVDTTNTEDMNDFDDNRSSFTMGSSDDVSYKTETIWQLVAALVFGIGALFEFYSTFLDDYYEDQDDWDDDAYLIKMEGRRKWYVSNYKIDTIGMHLYLLSGVIMLIAQRNSYRSGWKFECCFDDIRRLCFGSQDDVDQDNSEEPESSNPIESSNRLAQLLMLLGTVLFVCGTLLDCTIAWMSDPAIRHEMDPTNHLNELTLPIYDLISSILWNVDAVLYICADILLYSLHKNGSKGRKWLFKKRVHCSCTEIDDEEMEEDDETPMLMFPDLGRHDSVEKPLLRGSSLTSYSSF